MQATAAFIAALVARDIPAGAPASFGDGSFSFTIKINSIRLADSG
jgi:hypothetical protein